MSYRVKRGNVYYYSNPGCSIDPDPDVIQKLQTLGQQIFNHSSSTRIKEGIEKWHSICQLPQNVRVLGIPFDTHFAVVMVKADYDMKTLVDGSDSLNIPGFTSLTDMTLEKAKNDIVQEKPLSIPLYSMNRFWFYPGENHYIEDSGIVIIKQSPVILLTEEEYLDRRGEIVRSGYSNPLAQEFTESFSSLYTDVAKQRPIYAELESLFRFVALAKIMKFKSPHKEIGLDLWCFLEDFRIPEMSLKTQLPGRANVKEFEHRQDFYRSYRTIQLWLPSCGGVSIDIEISHRNFEKDTSGKLSKLRDEVLKARPSPEALCWDFPLIYKVRFNDGIGFVFIWQGDKDPSNF
ncbi:MAG: DUF1598 domain-containing protein [bacterium]